MAKLTELQFNKVENPRTQIGQNKGGGKMATEIKLISLPAEAYNTTREQFKTAGKLDEFNNTFRLKGSVGGFAGEIAKDYADEIEEIQKGVNELNKKMVADQYINNEGVQGGARLQFCAVSNFTEQEREHMRTATGFDKFGARKKRTKK